MPFGRGNWNPYHTRTWLYTTDHRSILYSVNLFHCKPRGLNCQQETAGGVDVFTSSFELHFRRFKSWIWIDGLANLRTPQKSGKYDSTRTRKPCDSNDPWSMILDATSTLQRELVAASWDNKWLKRHIQKFHQLAAKQLSLGNFPKSFGAWTMWYPATVAPALSNLGEESQCSWRWETWCTFTTSAI